jgi:hypothetical protein
MSHLTQNINDLPFEQRVIADLAELKTDMKSLVGNGQPGRVTKLEAKVTSIIIALVVIAVAVFGPKSLLHLIGF